MTVRAFVNGEMATSGSKVFLTGAEAVAQNIETRLRWFYGEAFLEPRGGTPWFQSILGKARGFERESSIKRVILNTLGVVRLNSFQLTQDGHTLNVTGSVKTIYSQETSFRVSI